MVPRHDLTARRLPEPSEAPTGAPPAGPPAPRGPQDTTTAGEALAGYLNRQAAELLRGLRLHDENAGSAETAAQAAEAVRLLRRSARRISGALHTFRPLLDSAWADRVSAELRWLSGVLAREHAYAARLDRLLAALHRLSSPAGGGDGGPGGERDEPPRTGRPGAGAAKAGALLERQLTLARTRAHSAALRALGSGRFHAVADEVAVLASDAPVQDRAADRPAELTLGPLAELTHRRLVEAVAALPTGSQALAHTLTAEEGRHDAAWHQVRHLARLTRYGLEVLVGDPGADDTTAPLHGALLLAGHQLDRHRDAAEAAAAAAAAGRTPRIAPTTAYALGVLHADQRHEVEAARAAFTRIWPTP
ncbi:CHAD domain-containing protein [Streptomyces sp. OF3]|uniref:CHAD domain-containing protein n=1 Tax=Streptomyces alkaliterrae TaxID=2213162 RepID=A0A7W3WHN9_9ACTN|nr:CHAD domain-containing protein [Streptomyces alkaliterrae]MBB1252365.1 CHAD domain-containing protein [Streptomyces alkaliterrae]